MENQNEISVVANELDDFVLDEEDSAIGDVPMDNFVSQEQDVSIIKEEPVLSSLDDAEEVGSIDQLETVESNIEELESMSTDESSIDIGTSESEEVIFSDELPDSTKSNSLDNSNEIVIDDEVEQIVKDTTTADDTILGNDNSEEIADFGSETSDSVKTSQDQVKSFFDEDDDETISLSSDELSNILEDADETALRTEEVPTVDSVLKDKAPDTTLPEEGEEIEEIEEALVDDLTEVSTDNIDSLDIMGSEDVKTDDIPSIEQEDVLVGSETEITDISDTVDSQSDEAEKAIEKEEAELGELEATLEPESVVDEMTVADEGLVDLEDTINLESDTSDKPFEESLEELQPPSSLREDSIIAETSSDILKEDSSDGVSETTSTEPEGVQSSFFEEDEDESISLTGSELDDILQDADVSDETGTVDEEDNSVLSDIPEATTETLESLEEVSPIENIQNAMPEEVVEELDMDDEMNKASSGPGVGIPALNVEIDKEQLKKVIKYLDTMLDNLPEEKIKEFADSEYYELYNKLLDSLGV